MHVYIYRHGRFSYVDTTPTPHLEYWGRYPPLHVPPLPLGVGNFSAVDLRQSATLGMHDLGRHLHAGGAGG